MKAVLPESDCGFPRHVGQDMDLSWLGEASLHLVDRKYGSKASRYIALRRHVGYVTPEDHYEALIERLVTPETEWLDVGCGSA